MKVRRRTRNGPEGHSAARGKPEPGTGAVFTWPIRVYYEDTDAGGVVYYANYLRFMERARTEWLRHLGFEQDALRDRFGILFVVAGVKLDYHRPARFNQQLLVSVEVSSVKRASLLFWQTIQAGDNVRVCSAEVRIACVDDVNFKPKPLPPEIVAELI